MGDGRLFAEGRKGLRTISYPRRKDPLEDDAII